MNATEVMLDHGERLSKTFLSFYSEGVCVCPAGNMLLGPQQYKVHSLLQPPELQQVHWRIHYAVLLKVPSLI